MSAYTLVKVSKSEYGEMVGRLHKLAYDQSTNIKKSQLPNPYPYVAVYEVPEGDDIVLYINEDATRLFKDFNVELPVVGETDELLSGATPTFVE